ncbi:hypothetical protein WR25_09245 [Diploscapter pachys]|uniref:General transcription factor IIH subunit 4 n=1 Tax=Diploscapter pachys TaxID=2018661 RepID=A0A2A2LZX8_9BILA|nr:hypothetical protein WR25_09245 [Diploscapter pachys]
MASDATPHSLLSFICTLPVESRLNLISKPSSAFFLFRILPSVSQQIIIRLLHTSDLPLSADTRPVMSNCIALLQTLQILAETDSDRLRLCPEFSQAYLEAIQVGAHRCAGIDSNAVDEKKQKDVGKKSAERWECILRYLALPSDNNISSVSDSTRHLFRLAGFTKEATVDEITSAGFQFLLLDTMQQIWTYIIEYLKLALSREENVVELVHLLIQTILCSNPDEQRRSFSISNAWNESEMNLLMQLREIGVIFIRKRKDGVFFVTPLLRHLSSTSAVSFAADKSSGYIVVETNFRLYAYTKSTLQLAILSTFTEMTYRFNDMSVGILSRESVRRALQVGITALQIITYLRTNAHPQTLSAGARHCLPITVADQIRLWEDERKRLVFDNATFYSTFESEKQYTDLRDFAQKEEILLWADNKMMLVIVKDEGHDLIKQWWKSCKEANAGGGK